MGLQLHVLLTCTTYKLFYIQLQSESDSYKVEIFCKLIINYIKWSGRNHIHPNFHMGIQKQAYRIDFTLGFQ